MTSIRSLAVTWAMMLALLAAPVSVLGGTAPVAGAPTNSEASASGSVQQAAGLMWNRTGLPAVFPLQVMTPIGQDYYLTLRDAQTGEAALAAYITGGDFFKVLVPPGTYAVRFHIGQDWKGEEDLFGSGTQTRILDLEAPLTFEIRNFGTKAGHLIDLTHLGQSEASGPQIKDQIICQTVRMDAPPAPYSFLKSDRVRPNGLRDPIVPPKGPLRYEDRDLFGTALDPTYPGDQRGAQGYRIWSDYCQ